MISFPRRGRRPGSAILSLGLAAALGPALAAQTAPSVGPVQVTLVWPGHPTITLDDVTIVQGIEPAPTGGGIGVGVGVGRIRQGPGQLVLRRPVFPISRAIGAGTLFQTDLQQWNDYEPSRARKEVTVQITVFDAASPLKGKSKDLGDTLNLTCDYQNCTPLNWALVTGPGPDSDPAGPGDPPGASRPGKLEEQLEISYERLALSWSEPAN